MRRSGTHWLGYLISNYILFLNDSENLLDNNGTAFKEVFHNSRNGIIWFGVELAEHRVGTIDAQKRHYFYSHIKSAAENASFFLGKRILLYSNPRDWTVPRHNNLQNRSDMNYPGGNLSNYLDSFMAEYYKAMTALRALCQTEDDILVSYEELVEDTPAALRRVVHFLELPLDEDAINYSVERSSAKSTKLQESQGMVIGRSLNGRSFVNSAQVGQWKSAMSKSDINFIDT